MTYPEPDPRDARQVPPESVVPPAEEMEVLEREHSRVRVVRIVCAVIHAVCALFALVLAVHIVLVVGEANSRNGFAELIGSWSSGVSLGLRDLFTLQNFKIRTLCNDGLAAILWLVIGAVVTDLIARVALPGPRRVWYRRTVR